MELNQADSSGGGDGWGAGVSGGVELVLRAMTGLVSTFHLTDKEEEVLKHGVSHHLTAGKLARTFVVGLSCLFSLC